MKHIGLFVALLLVMGCSYSVEQEEQSYGNDSHKFHAVIDDVEDNDSRVYLDNKIRILWNANDYISLFEGTTRNKQFVFLGDDGDNAGDFDLYRSGFGSGNDIDCYYALYPYASTTKYIYGDSEGVNDYIRYNMPSVQTYSKGSVGHDANIMVAVTQNLDDFDLIFRNVCSFLRIRLYGEDQTVGSIIFSGNNNEVLAGNIAITPVYGGVPSVRMLGSTTQLTLDCNTEVVVGTTANSATEFWLVIPPLTFTNGFTITVNGYYGGSQTYTIPNNLTFVRNTYNTLTRELEIQINGAGMGFDNWGDGGEDTGTAD